MGSSLFEQLTLARFIASGVFARHLRHVRPIYRRRRDALIAALAASLPGARWQGEAGGLHLYVEMPDEVDAFDVARSAYGRGVLLELGSWHWAARRDAPPAFVLGYGSATEQAIRRGVRTIAEAIASTAQRGR